MPNNKLRSDLNIRWIEEFCVIPDGPRKGQPVRLSNAEKETLRQIYDVPQHAQEVTITERPLAAYLALLHLCGLEHGVETPLAVADIWTVYNVAGPEVVPHIQRKGAAIVCPALGLRYPRAA